MKFFSGSYFPVFELNTEIYSVRMRENADQNNSEYGHILRSDHFRFPSMKPSCLHYFAMFITDFTIAIV